MWSGNLSAFSQHVFCPGKPQTCLVWTTHHRKPKSHFSQSSYFSTCSFSLFCVWLVPLSDTKDFYPKDPKKQSQETSRGFPKNVTGGGWSSCCFLAWQVHRAVQVQQQEKAGDLYEKSMTRGKSYFLSMRSFDHNDTLVPLTVLGFLGMRPDVAR